MTTDTRDRDDTVFERLAQRFEHRAGELRKLIKEENASV